MHSSENVKLISKNKESLLLPPLAKCSRLPQINVEPQELLFPMHSTLPIGYHYIAVILTRMTKNKELISDSNSRIGNLSIF